MFSMKERISPPNMSNDTQEDKAVRSVRAEAAEQDDVRAMLKFLKVQEAPKSIHRINPFLVKVELPSRSALATVLKNRRLLSSTKWPQILVRESQTKEERERIKALRWQRAYLEETESGQWALYKNSLRWRSDIMTDRTDNAPNPPHSWKPATPRANQSN